MSHPVSSRAPSCSTLADVLAAVERADLPLRKRQNMASAVRRVAAVLGSPPGQVPADPALLARRLTEIAPAAHGITKRSWNNIRSLLRAAVALIQPVAPGRHVTGLSAEWRALFDRLPDKLRIGSLSRLMHHLSAAGIRPADVQARHFEGFGDSLRTSLVKEPARSYRAACTAWNHAQQTVPGWPDIAAPVAAPQDGYVYVRTWDAFPVSLRNEAQSWLDRLAGKSFEDIPFKPVRPETIKHRDYALRRFASALIVSGRDPTSLARLADLVEITAVKAGLRYLLDRNGGKPSTSMFDVLLVLRSIAKHWVKVDQTQFDQLSAIARKLAPPKQGMTEKNRRRLTTFNDPALVRNLVNLPLKLMQHADRTAARRPKRAAFAAQMAVAIELLLVAPVRLGNLARLDIRKHLVRPVAGTGKLTVTIAAEEVKNGMPLEFPLGEESVALIERYLAVYRPHLAGLGCTAFFPGPDGSCKTKQCLGEQISETVFQHLGVQVNPHMFRHIAAKIYLDANPGGYGVVQRLLGHKSINTTMSAYTGLEAAQAVRHYDALVHQLRQDGRKAA